MHPLGRHHPGKQPPRETSPLARHPLAQTPPWADTSPRQTHIPAPTPETATTADGTHPIGMLSSLVNSSQNSSRLINRKSEWTLRTLFWNFFCSLANNRCHGFQDLWELANHIGKLLPKDTGLFSKIQAWSAVLDLRHR